MPPPRSSPWRHSTHPNTAGYQLRSQTLTLRDVQTILGHAQLTTTQVYLITDDHEVLARTHRYLAGRAPRFQPPPLAAGYDGDDMAVLLGAGPR